MDEHNKQILVIALGASMFAAVISGGIALNYYIDALSAEKMAKMGYVQQNKVVNGYVRTEWVKVGESNK